MKGVTHHVTFSAAPRKVASVLDKDQIVMEVWRLSNIGRPDEKVGEAQISLAPLKTTNAPRVLTGAVMDQEQVQVGVVKVELMMADDGEDGVAAQPPPVRVDSAPSTGYVSESLEEMRAKAVLEIEDWKRNQKKEFRKQVHKPCYVLQSLNYLVREKPKKKLSLQLCPDQMSQAITVGLIF